MNIKPIEDFVFEGLAKRMQQVFGCQCVYTTANDKTKVLARMFEGRAVTYPYIFLTLQSVAPNTESYVNHMLMRRGLPTVINDGFMHTVRVIPTNFEIEVEFVTNQFQGQDQGNVLAFAKRWMFARRCGYLKFTVNYGALELKIAMTLNDNVPTPPLENKVESETAYKVTTSMVVHGFVSESDLGTQGIVQSVEVNGAIMNTDGSLPGSQFTPF